MAAPTTAAGWLALYQLAESEILSYGQTNAVEGRTQTLADLPNIVRGRKEWERRVQLEARINAGGGCLNPCRVDFS